MNLLNLAGLDLSVYWSLLSKWSFFELVLSLKLTQLDYSLFLWPLYTLYFWTSTKQKVSWHAQYILLQRGNSVIQLFFRNLIECKFLQLTSFWHEFHEMEIFQMTFPDKTFSKFVHGKWDRQKPYMNIQLAMEE